MRTPFRLQKTQQKRTLYKTLIEPIVLYGHEAWTMLEEDQQVLANSDFGVFGSGLYKKA